MPYPFGGGEFDSSGSTQLTVFLVRFYVAFYSCSVRCFLLVSPQRRCSAQPTVLLLLRFNRKLRGNAEV